MSMLIFFFKYSHFYVFFLGINQKLITRMVEGNLFFSEKKVFFIYFLFLSGIYISHKKDDESPLELPNLCRRALKISPQNSILKKSKLDASYNRNIKLNTSQTILTAASNIKNNVQAIRPKKYVLSLDILLIYCFLL
jgi:hypothetical protein